MLTNSVPESYTEPANLSSRKPRRLADHWGIRTILHHRKLTTEAAGELAGLSQTGFSMTICGNRHNPETQARIAAALGVPLDQIFPVDLRGRHKVLAKQ